MPFEEYWIGKDIDLEQLWRDFEEGAGYIEKYKSMNVHLLRLTFNNYPVGLPLFNHEAVFKTVKGTFHNLKKDAFSEEEYQRFGPIFLYKADRSSEQYSFLAELVPLIMYGTALILSGIYAYQKITKQSLENAEKKLSILKTHFPYASKVDAEAFMNALTPLGRNKILRKLVEQNLKKVEISKEPFTGNIQETEEKMLDLGSILESKEERT